jgi:addiction module HigA family antidote
MARTPIHPGEILADELEETGLSAKKLADVIEVPPNRLYQILAGKRNVTADTALRLSQYFGMSADFWMNLQAPMSSTSYASKTARPYSAFRSAAKQRSRCQRLECQLWTNEFADFV